MIVDEASLIQSMMDQHPVGRALLAAYAARQDRSPTEPWLERIEDTAEIGAGEIEPEELSRMHGKLIAMGLLDFEVTAKGTGVRYQLSTLGRTSLMRVSPSDESDEEESEKDFAA